MAPAAACLARRWGRRGESRHRDSLCSRRTYDGHDDGGRNERAWRVAGRVQPRDRTTVRSGVTCRPRGRRRRRGAAGQRGRNRRAAPGAVRVHAGYNAMPDRTVEAWRNFWFHTGDAGRQDQDGYFYFVDRIKDTIRRRGENLSSYEIERVLIEHPAVAEAAAVAVRSEIAGGEDEVKACVVLTPGHALSPEALLDFCQTRMPHFA